MRLHEYKERLSRLTDSSNVTLKCESYADAMPGWIPILENISKEARRLVEKYASPHGDAAIRYWVDRESIRLGRPKLRYAHYWNRDGAVDDSCADEKLVKVMRRFERVAKNACAICACKLTGAQKSDDMALRCVAHGHIAKEDLCDDLWEDLVGSGASEMYMCMRIINESIARWNDLQLSSHKTRTKWYERYALGNDDHTTEAKRAKHNEPIYLSEIALRYLVRKMGGELSNRMEQKWLSDVAARIKDAYEHGVDDIFSLGSVLVLSLQEHGRYHFVASGLDVFLARNSLEIVACVDSMRMALDCLSNGSWSVSTFASWLAENSRSRAAVPQYVAACEANYQRNGRVQ